jgi:hypothetical protein
MHEYSIALRISGTELNPVEITTNLELIPTQVRNRGERRSDKSNWAESMWEYAARGNGETFWSSLEEGLDALLLDFQRRIDAVRHYQKTFDVALWCGHFSSSFDGGPLLSPALLKRLGEFGVALYIDTYFFEEPNLG